MRRTRIAIAAAACIMLAGIVPASARDVADKQGFCKKQGPSSCAGASECSGGHIDLLPVGQQKKC